MTPDELRELEEHLRSAQSRLIMRADPKGDGSRVKLTPHIREGERVGDEIIEEGFDPDRSPLGCPVFWRVVVRDGKQFYCSTFQATRDQIKKTWGKAGLVCCDPVTGTAVACIETAIRRKP
jgi:hypothetical protein